MCNIKVYLAKSILAKGLDVEYVKSSLSRIEGIDIVEYGMGIAASECQAFVLVPEESYIVREDEELSIGKNVFNDMNDFIENGEYAECDALDYVFIFSGREVSDRGDVESITPMARNPYELEENDKTSFDDYGVLTINSESFGLLSTIGEALDIYTDWEKVPRHHQPEPQFAIPPVPSFDERRMKKSVVMDKLGEAMQNPFTPSQCYSKRRLLLRRRK